MNQPLDFSNYKFRASMIGALMTNPKGNSPKEIYDAAVAKYNTEKDKLQKSYEDNEQKIADTPENKQHLKGYQALKEKRAKIENDFTYKLKPLADEVNRLKVDADKPFLSETCKKKLLEIYIHEKTGRLKDIENRYINKGNAVEEKTIELLSDIDDRMYVKNMERRFDDFFQGECDIDDSDVTDTIIDAKSSWDIFTFISKTIEKLNFEYWCQGQIYLELYDAENYILAYGLIDTPEDIIEDQKKRLLWKMGSGKAGSEVYRLGCQEIEMNLTFADLLPEERVIRYSFKRDREFIKLVQERVWMWRKWLNDYAKSEYERIMNKTIVPYETEESEVTVEVTVNDTVGTVIEKLQAVDTSKIMDVEYEDTKPTQATEGSVSTVIAGMREDDEERERLEDEEFRKSVVIQKDLEDEIKEIKSENGTLLPELLKRIENCKSVEETIDLYKEIKPYFDSYPQLKEKITEKKTSFAPREERQSEPEKPKSVGLKPENPTPSTSTESKSEIRTKLEEELNTLKTADAVREFWRNNVDYINENPDFKKAVELYGMKRSTHPIID